MNSYINIQIRNTILTYDFRTTRNIEIQDV